MTIWTHLVISLSGIAFGISLVGVMIYYWDYQPPETVSRDWLNDYWYRAGRKH